MLQRLMHEIVVTLRGTLRTPPDYCARDPVDGSIYEHMAKLASS